MDAGKDVKVLCPNTYSELGDVPCWKKCPNFRSRTTKFIRSLPLAKTVQGTALKEEKTAQVSCFEMAITVLYFHVKFVVANRKLAVDETVATALWSASTAEKARFLEESNVGANTVVLVVHFLASSPGCSDTKSSCVNMTGANNQIAIAKATRIMHIHESV
jgi:hypothetical protein